MAIPVVSFVGFIFTNAQALRHLSLPVLTVWKSLAPLAVTIVEAIYFRSSFPPSVYAAMSLVAFSALVTAKFDLEYSPIGYAWAAANLLMNVAYLLTLRICLHNSNASSLDKTFHSNFLSLFLILPASFLANEVPAVFDAFESKNLTFKICFVLSGALTTAVCASAFLTIQLTSGSTMSFVGGMNKIPIVLISLLIFDDNISAMGWVGVILGILAGIVFVRAKAISSPYSLVSTDSDSSPKIASSKSCSSSESTLRNGSN